MLVSGPRHHPLAGDSGHQHLVCGASGAVPEELQRYGGALRRGATVARRGAAIARHRLTVARRRLTGQLQTTQVNVPNPVARMEAAKQVVEMRAVRLQGASPAARDGATAANVAGLDSSELARRFLRRRRDERRACGCHTTQGEFPHVDKVAGKMCLDGHPVTQSPGHLVTRPQMHRVGIL